jgi:Rod binding domain-containing protein
MLPPIDTSLFPPEVRNAGPEAEKLYGAALQFEGMLTSQITQQMFDAAKDLGGGDEENGDSNPYQSMLPTALSDSITAAGGMGLAKELYRSFGGAFLSSPPVGDAAGGEEAAA